MEYFPPRHRNEKIYVTLEFNTREDFLAGAFAGTQAFWLDGNTAVNTSCLEAVFTAHYTGHIIVIGTNSTKHFPPSLLRYFGGVSKLLTGFI